MPRPKTTSRAKVLGDDVEVGKGTQNAYSIVQIECGLLA